VNRREAPATAGVSISRHFVSQKQTPPQLVEKPKARSEKRVKVQANLMPWQKSDPPEVSK
jgi:hypothetical protein